MELQKSTLEPEQKLSAPQKKFQKLCQKIEQEQLRLNEWQTAQADIQARAIVEMRLRQLTGLEQDKLHAEFEEIQRLIAHLNDILNNEEQDGLLNHCWNGGTGICRCIENC